MHFSINRSRLVYVYTPTMSTDDDSLDFEIVNESELSPDEEADLSQYKLALEQEFAQSGSLANQRKTAKETKEAINDLIPAALTGLKRIMTRSDKDATVLKACTWVLENALSLKGLANTDDPMADLLEEIADTQNSSA